MKERLKELMRSAAMVAASVAVCGLVYAQQPGMFLLNAIQLGHLIQGGSGGTAVPTFTNCTAVGTPSDTAGECTTSSTTATVTFAQPWATAPYCTVVDATSAATVPQVSYTTTTTAISVTVVTTAHNLFWRCDSRVAG